jgi:hypothetical protein
MKKEVLVLSILIIFSISFVSSQIADPTALPTLSDTNYDFSAYSALNVLGMPAGTSFVDPSSGRWYLKITGSNAPSGSSKCKPNYGAGGPFVSLPWGVGGVMRTVLVQCSRDGSSDFHALINVDTSKIGTGEIATSNYRLAPITTRSLTGAFSRNPNTPQILYYRSGADNRIHRYNTATDSNADTGVFPLSAAPTDISWMTAGGNDEFITAMERNNQGGVLYVWDMNTGSMQTLGTGNSFNEGHIEADGRYVWADWQGSDDGEIFDSLNNWASTGGIGQATTHPAMSGKYVMFHNDRNGGVSAFDADTETFIDSYPAVWDDNPYLKFGGHIGHQWGSDFGNPTDSKRWFLYSHDGSGSNSARQGQISFINPAGDIPRVAAYSYDNFVSPNYNYQVHASLSADGQIVLWNSNMGQPAGEGRFDAFLTIIPTKSSSSFCGDNVCNGTETFVTCPSDCPSSFCPDGVCNGTETYATCPADCPATTYFGDLNHDGKITISDIMIIMRHILNRETNWDSDVDEDGEVNIFDLVKVARIWGKQYETDTTAPTVVHSMPSQNILPLGTTTAIVGVETDERAICRYNPTPTNFASMIAFDRTGGIQHTKEEAGLQDDQNYLYYVQCRDEAGNLNSTDYLINFSVGSYSNGNGEPTSFCPDGVCNGTETSETCVEDCPIVTPYCGDNNCDANESCSSCEADCGVCSSPSFGLVAAYSFNEGTGTILTDSSGNSNHGTINGATRTTGKYGNGLNFDGVDDLVSIPNSGSLDITGKEITLEAWAYPESTIANGARIVSKRTDGGGSEVYALYLSDTNFYKFRLDGTTDVTSPNTINYNKWYHVVGVYNSTHKILYVDGTLKAIASRTENIDSSTKGVFIGHREAEDRWFNGIIDELRIYNRTLTQAEILNDMNSPII